jgi:predicted aspartyl protease
MPDVNKVLFVSTHFSGKALKWLRSCYQDLGGVDWNCFKDSLIKQFSAHGTSNLASELNHLSQQGKVEDYIERFEDLRMLVIEFEPYLREPFFLKCFVGGLQLELKNMVEINKPNSLAEAISIARLLEPSINSIIQKARQTSSRFSNTYPKGENRSNVGDSSRRNTTNLSIPVKRISSQEMQQRREKGLCWYCDEHWTYGHKCKKPQLYWIHTQEEEENLEVVVHPDQNEDTTCETFEISLQALQGGIPHQAFILMGTSNKVPLRILVDSGSTHNFIDPETAKKIGCKVTTTDHMLVTVADGSRIASNALCQALSWTTQGQHFTTEVRLLPLRGYDIILGVQWLKQVGPVTLDLNNLTMGIKLQGKHQVLQGHQGQKNEVKLIQAASLCKLEGQYCNFIGKLSFVHGLEKVEEEIPGEIKFLLKQFKSIFDPPKGLPPSRLQDHQIPLKNGAEPFSIRPYRYPYVQKTEIEKLIQEMLMQGIIRPSNSPFASPVLLVKKKDGTWRMCVDYRELNKLTVKNKFPIPLIDELLEELKGAAIFTKLDLRSGYHQIRVKPEDVTKTAFQTHEGHYEVLVMPFGLTNAPASFQELMNSVFKPFLRKFILVFFDDILVYSSSIQEHIEHLTQTFEILRQNQLFVKQSKCTFGQKSLEYLGHIISAEGVAADNSKIEAMLNWPQPKTVKALRGFLGLTGYYRKFVKNYGIISRPLTNLLKKNSFQ